jgi:DNA anti-recombination protein RmuC
VTSRPPPVPKLAGVAQHDIEELLTQVIGTGARRLEQVAAALDEQLQQHARNLMSELDALYRDAVAAEMSQLRSDLHQVASELADVVDEQRQRLVHAGIDLTDRSARLETEFAELDEALLADVRQSLNAWQADMVQDRALPTISPSRHLTEGR